MTALSLVIPVYNEQDSLVELHAEIDSVAAENGYDIQIVFVDDGSKDSSWQRITELSQKDERVEGVRFRRNFGKAAGLSAGIAHAKNDLMFTLDADLQDDPKEIPRFLAKMEEGLDVVSGWKQIRHDPWHKVGPSRVFNRLVSWLTGVQLHDHNCGFKCYRREIFDEVKLYGELHRFIPVLAASRGWQVGEITVEHRAREHGVSKYGWMRIPKGFLDLLTVKFITGYGKRPQHVLGMLGLIGFGLGALSTVWLTMTWFLSRMFAGWEDVSLSGSPPFYYALTALVLGTQLLATGFLAELITATRARHGDEYSISETTTGKTGV